MCIVLQRKFCLTFAAKVFYNEYFVKIVLSLHKRGETLDILGRAVRNLEAVASYFSSIFQT